MAVNKNRLEIIITDESGRPESVPFTDLHKRKDTLQSIMFLWDTNCYFVSREENTFIINGGRKLPFPDMGSTHIVYRKRTKRKISGTSEGRESIEWIVGLQNEKNIGVLLCISETGHEWKWRDRI